MNKISKFTVMLIALMLAVSTVTAYATEPTQAEIGAFRAAMALFEQRSGDASPDMFGEPEPPADPANPAP